MCSLFLQKEVHALALLNLSIFFLGTSVVRIKCDGGTSEADIGEGIRELGCRRI